MKRVLVTGGTSGIGLAITKLFVSNGFDVIVLARDFSTFPKSLKQKTKQVVFDLSKVSEIPSLAQGIGDIDILINNAGATNSLPYDKYPKDQKDMIIKINLEAPVALITEFSKGMMRRGTGRIVSVASVAGQTGSSDIWYGITKAGVINFTKSFARILGERGIIINCVAPGMVEGTNMFDAISSERKQNHLKRVLTHDFIKTKSVAETVYWLATESPVYINGTCLDINNGIYMR
ncbi:MAG TPA: SDR family oxidoreductase [Patescibacteria group bacterium]|nr:SDR family oxidoreductase [Patescibacteria group bacterium]